MLHAEISHGRHLHHNLCIWEGLQGPKENWWSVIIQSISKYYFHMARKRFQCCATQLAEKPQLLAAATGSSSINIAQRATLEVSLGGLCQLYTSRKTGFVTPSVIWVWINTYRYSLLGDEHPFTSYFDVHQGYKVLTHCHFGKVNSPGLPLWGLLLSSPSFSALHHWKR